MSVFKKYFINILLVLVISSYVRSVDEIQHEKLNDFYVEDLIKNNESEKLISIFKKTPFLNQKNQLEFNNILTHYRILNLLKKNNYKLENGFLVEYLSSVPDIEEGGTDSNMIDDEIRKLCFDILGYNLNLNFKLKSYEYRNEILPVIEDIKKIIQLQSFQKYGTRRLTVPPSPVHSNSINSIKEKMHESLHFSKKKSSLANVSKFRAFWFILSLLASVVLLLLIIRSRVKDKGQSPISN